MSAQAKRELLRSVLRKQAALDAAHIRMSPAQMRLWNVEANEAASDMHTFAIANYLQGPLDVAVLHEAIRAVAARHPALRVRIACGSEHPHFQPILDSGVPLKQVDLAEQEYGGLEPFLREEASLPMDLTVDRAWRCTLFKCAPDEYVLLLCFHHIISDRWSMGVFLRDLGQTYVALLDGSKVLNAEVIFPPESDEDAESAAHLAFWRQLYCRRPAPLELPLASGTNGFGRYAGERLEAQIDAGTLTALKRVAAAAGTTLFPVLLAAFGALLHTQTGQEDLVICTPVIGRHRANTQCVIGYYNNILPLRLDLSGDAEFASLAGRVSIGVREAYTHQDVSFQSLTALPELEGVRTTRCLFTVQNIPGLALRLPGVTSSYRDIPNGKVNFDLSIFLEERSDHMVVLLDYKTAVFTADAAYKIKDRFLKCLQFAASTPAARLSEFPDYRVAPSAARSAESIPSCAEQPVANNMLEHRMIDLWKDLFHEQSGIVIHPNTDFFDIGGDSMRAARLFARMKREFALEWPLATLIEAPTPRLLVQRMSDSEWVAPWMSLIPLRTTGGRPPLFFIPGGAGGILCFRQIADCLGQDQPIYCLQARGLKPGEQPLHTVEEVAAYYLGVIRHLRPHGPYMFAGHSFGAVAAYEMTRLLIEAGEKVPILAVFDHCGPDIKLSVIDYLRFSFTGLVMVNREERLRYLRRALVWKFQERWIRRRVKRSTLSERGQEDAVWSAVDLFEGTIRALAKYAFPPIPARLTLFRAQQRPKIHQDPYGGWGRVALGGVDVYEVQGTHNNMLKEPQVQALGQKLAECIERLH